MNQGLEGPRGQVKYLAFSPSSNRLVSGSSDATEAMVWSIPGMKRLFVLKVMGVHFDCGLFIRNESFLTGNKAKLVVWDIEARSNTKEALLPSLTDQSCMALSPNAQWLLVYCIGSAVSVYNMETFDLVNTISIHGKIRRAAFADDEAIIITPEVGSMVVIDINTGTTLTTFDGVQYAPSAVAVIGKKGMILIRM